MDLLISKTSLLTFLAAISGCAGVRFRSRAARKPFPGFLNEVYGGTGSFLAALSIRGGAADLRNRTRLLLGRFFREGLKGFSTRVQRSVSRD
jgi:hypothetical protein